jgi:opacity protein-like surface antigen
MKRLVLLVGVLAVLAGRAAAESASNSIQIGLKGSSSQETSEHNFDWGPTISAEIHTSSKTASNRFKYEMEYSYDDSLSKISSEGSSQSTRVRTSELRYGKLSLLQVHGYDLKERLHFVPYVAGGVQYVDSRATGDSSPKNDFYWAPTWGVGVEFALNKRTTLALDYDANALGDGRRISHLSLELKVAVLGDLDE